MSNLTNNTTTIQNLINKINSLPEADSGGTNTSDATITADEVFAGEVAYGANGRLTGTFTIDSELTTQNNLISQISQLVATKATPSGGTNTDDATATAADILSGKTAYVKGEKVTGTIATKTSSNLTASGATVTVPAGYYSSQATKSVGTATQATPSVSVSSSGLITASATQTAGYVNAGTKSGTKQLTTKAATTYTPSTSNQTISSGTYLTGTQTIKGDSNLVAANIKSGVSIFGVAGSYEGSGSGGSIETCTVTITEFSNNIEAYCYTAFENNVLTPKGDTYNITCPLTLNNVVCGSAIFVSNRYNMNGVTVGGGVEVSVPMVTIGGIFRAPIVAGASGTIDIYDDD